MSSKTVEKSPWKVYTIESTGKKYWYNKATKEKSWKDPNSIANSNASDAPSKVGKSTPVKDAAKPAGATVAPATTKDNTAKVSAASTTVEPKVPAAPTGTNNSGSKAPANKSADTSETSSPWKVYTLDSGKKYWYNKATKEKSWTDPSKTAVKDSASQPEAPASSRAALPSKDMTKNPSNVAPQAKAATPNPSANKDLKAPVSKAVIGNAALTEKTVKANPEVETNSPSKLGDSKAAHPPATAPATHTSATAPAAHTSASAVGSSRDLVAAHDIAPNEHVTVEVKSKKKNWRGALDVGLKVLDSALERAKKGEDLERSAGHAPVVKGPVRKEAAHSAPPKPSQVVPLEVKGGHPEASRSVPSAHAGEANAGVFHEVKSTAAKDATPKDAHVERPKAQSKLSWKSPFKKHAAEQNSEKGVLDNAGPKTEDAIASSGVTPTHAGAAVGPATTQLTGRSQAGHDEFATRDDVRHGQSESFRQSSSVGNGATGTALGALSGAAAGAVGYRAYDAYGGGGGSDGASAPPSPPPEEEFGDDSTLPSPPEEEEGFVPEEKDDTSRSLASDDAESGPPSPPSEEGTGDGSTNLATQGDDNVFPTTPSSEGENESASEPPSPPASDAGGEASNNADYTTYAFEQPPSPENSNPPTPPAQEGSHSDQEQASPSPGQLSSPHEPASPTRSASPLPASPSPSASPARSASSPPASPSPSASPKPADDSDSD